MLNRPEVYIGGDNSHDGAWPNDGVVSRYLSAPEEWAWVRDNVDGYYLNNFAFLGSNDWMPLMRDLLKNKNAFYETDIVHSSDEDDQAHLSKLASIGFDVKYSALNKDGGDPTAPRWSQSRLDTLKAGAGRPVLAMEGPHAVDGSISSARATYWRDAIGVMDGASTDGPLGLWPTSEVQMVTRDCVHYAHDRGKLSMVMLASHLSGSGANVLQYGQECVRWLEKQGAMPDIWAISFYHFNGYPYPVTPETNPDNSAAGTVTGLAYWLINYLRGPRTVTVWPHQAAARHAQWREVEGTNGHIMLENRSIRTYLEVKNNNSGNPAPVGVYRHVPGTTHAQWTIQTMADGYFIIKDRNGGRSLQVDNASADPNAAVSVYKHIDGTAHAAWRKIERGGGWFSLVPKHNESALLQIDVSVDY